MDIVYIVGRLLVFQWCYLLLLYAGQMEGSRAMHVTSLNKPKRAQPTITTLSAQTHLYKYLSFHI